MRKSTELLKLYDFPNRNLDSWTAEEVRNALKPCAESLDHCEKIVRKHIRNLEIDGWDVTIPEQFGPYANLQWSDAANLLQSIRYNFPPLPFVPASTEEEREKQKKQACEDYILRVSAELHEEAKKSLPIFEILALLGVQEMRRDEKLHNIIIDACTRRNNEQPNDYHFQRKKFDEHWMPVVPGTNGRALFKCGADFRTAKSYYFAVFDNVEVVHIWPKY